MNLLFSRLAVSAALCISANAADNAGKFTRDYPNISIGRPISVVSPPDGTQRLFLVQQRGQILVLPKDRKAKEAKVFLDISGRDLEENEFEEGLVGFAFHPKFKENGRC